LGLLMKRAILLAALLTAFAVDAANAQHQPMRPIIVTLAFDAPFDPNWSSEEEQPQKKRIREAQLALVAELPQGTYRVVHLYDYTAQIALSVDEWAYSYLKTSKRVKAVDDDRPIGIPPGETGRPVDGSQPE
jgi:hypothetical protein